MSSATLEAPAPAAPSATPAVAPAAPVVDASTFERDVGTLAPDALSRLIPGPKPLRPAVQPPVAAPTPAPVAPPAAVEPTPAAVTPETPAAATPPTPEPELPKNWRLRANDAKEALVMELHKNGASLTDAYKEVYGSPTPEPAQQPAKPISEPTPQADPVAQVDTHIADLAKEVADLTSKINTAAEEGDTKTALLTQNTLFEKKLALQRANDQREALRQEIENRQVSTVVEQHNRLEQESLGRIFEAYPQLNDVKSAERAQFNLKVKELESNPAFGPKFRDVIPGWPEMVAKMVDAEKGWSRSAPTPAAPAPVPTAPKTMTTPIAPIVPVPLSVPPVRATSAEVITPGSYQGGTTPVANKETFWKDSANTDPDVLIRLMAKAPIDPRLLQRAKNDMRRHGA
jgi:hypothetical protein